jgi:vancomycin permeability regulator SanA
MGGVSTRPPSTGSRLRRYAQRLVLGAVLVAAVVVGGTAVRVWQVGRTDDRQHADTAVVLGAAQYDGRPSDVLRARLQHAKQLYDSGVVRYVVTVGGRRSGDAYTEAEAGMRWLVSEGVPKDHVLAVEEGSDTLRSLRAVAAAARPHGWHNAVIVSDPWHSLRARTMADDSGLDAWTSPTHTGPIVQSRDMELRYILRETAALLYYHVTRAPADDIGSGLG